tara:strand:+ start:95 stop:376 length:282 start_codon:yes stop_codon:yes gene_type:complete
MIECSGLDLLWWQWWILVMITVNTMLNLIVFFKHRFRKTERQKKKQKVGRPNVKLNMDRFSKDCHKMTVRQLSKKYKISLGKAHGLIKQVKSR